jgi:hypothetical protein
MLDEPVEALELGAAVDDWFQPEELVEAFVFVLAAVEELDCVE